MATTKRNKKGRPVATRVKAGARAARSVTSAKTTASKKSKQAAARPTAKAKPVRKAKPDPKTAAKPNARGAKRSTPPKRPAVAKPVGDSQEVAALKAKFQRERSGLEKNLTEAVREIGMLRHHELRATHLERQLGERDATIARLQTQLADLERRPAAPVYVHEVQQTLALGVAPAAEDATDLDAFEDDRLPEESSDVLADDE
jgi:hypothetical protein